MRRFVAVAMLALMGCGGAKRAAESRPAFTSEAEELEYLNDLGNPTPEQWKRRKRLQDQAKAEDEERETRKGARSMLAEAKSAEAEHPDLAARIYENFMDIYADTPEAEEAASRLKALREANRDDSSVK